MSRSTAHSCLHHTGLCTAHCASAHQLACAASLLLERASARSTGKHLAGSYLAATEVRCCPSPTTWRCCKPCLNMVCRARLALEAHRAAHPTTRRCCNPCLNTACRASTSSDLPWKRPGRPPPLPSKDEVLLTASAARRMCQLPAGPTCTHCVRMLVAAAGGGRRPLHQTSRATLSGRPVLCGPGLSTTGQDLQAEHLLAQ